MNVNNKEQTNPPENKKVRRLLFRSEDDYMFAGVIGGLAEFWNKNSTIMRLLFLLFIPLTGGLILVIYLILIKALPSAPEHKKDLPI
ncbi:MAG: PspC domain-containing protein [Candidatus Thorarchaeota archaeon]